MSTKWQRFSIDIPEDYGPAEREAIGEELIDYIVKRTQDGKGIGGKKFPGYSPEYVKSLEFKIAGKSKNDVNLTLSGDMLGAMTVLSHKKGKIMIGFENGTDENAIADGNIRGTYGKPEANPKRARNFLGMTQNELESVLSLFPVDSEESQDNADAASLARQGAKDAMSGIKTQDEEDT